MFLFFVCFVTAVSNIPPEFLFQHSNAAALIPLSGIVIAFTL